MEINREKRLADLLQAAGLKCDCESGIRINAVTADSREVQPGCLFIAVAGAEHDGHDYIAEAIDRGCAAVLAEEAPAGDPGVPVIVSPDTRESLGYIAAALYDYPAEDAVMIGITGTNGKTTTAWLVESILHQAGGSPGVIGTVNIRFQGEERHSNLTTPEPLELQKTLREMVDRGVTHVVMEVSSHALQQGRVNGLRFDVALFTNLSRDHLDYHPDMDGYFAVKKKLFSHYLKTGGTAVINQENGPADRERKSGPGGALPGSQWGKRLVVFLKDLNSCRVITAGLARGEVHAVSPEYSLEGIQTEIVTPAGGFHLASSLVGEFNLSNLIGAAGCGIALDIPLQVIRSGLEKMKNIPGRLERVPDPEQVGNNGGMAAIFVDYAHTPDALEHVLATLRPMVAERLIVVFGCGGDRDKGKRALMGEVAGRSGDIVILTSDNPRSEAPEDILRDIEKGLDGLPIARVGVEEMRKTGWSDTGPLTAGIPRHESGSRIQSEKYVYTVIEDRGAAITEAIQVSGPGDAVVICGKGHESYQIGKFGTIFFDDRLKAIKALKRQNKSW